MIDRLADRDQRISYRFADESAGFGAHWYYAQFEFKGDDHDLPWNLAPAFGSRAWTSPVWIDVQNPNLNSEDLTKERDCVIGLLQRIS